MNPPGTRAGLSVLAGSGALLVAPAAAQAHGLVGRQDLPIPRLLFVWAAAAVLVFSFVGLAALWPKSRLEGSPGARRLLTLPRGLDVPAGTVGVMALVGIVYAGLAGVQTPTANIAPTFVYVIFWVGLAFVSLVFGDVFRPFNPWRAIGRGIGWTAHRVAAGRMPTPLAYPAGLGRWPAALGLLAFAWLELVYGGAEDPSVVAIAALVYTAVQLLGMSLYGVENWSRYGESFGVYYGLLARIGPLDWRGRELWRRPLLSGATGVLAVPGTVALLVVLIGTTSFDGFSQGPTWNSLAPDLQSGFSDLGLGPTAALEVAFTLGLLTVVAVIGGLYRFGIRGMRSIDRRFTAGDLGGRFVHSLIPIALAYIIAHYFSYLAVQGQAMGYLVSDPLGRGTDLLGTASASIDYGLVSANLIWYVQVGALVLGHVAGLVLSHDRALVIYDNPRLAARSQYWMLTIMVAFTCLGLWLLSAGAT